MEVTQVMATASKYLEDYTVRHQFQATVPEMGITGFKFAVPSQELLDFSGPRGEAYDLMCKASFAKAASRCVCYSLCAIYCGTSNY